MSTGKLSMFGSSFNTVGTNEANLCLYTLGDVKVKTPNSFVTIFKNGKLIIDGQTKSFIFKVSSEDEMKKDGIYIVGDDKESKVFAYGNGTKILLASGENNSLSIDTKQDLNSTQINQAQLNIGLLFNTLEEAKKKNLTNGVVYILSENNFYKIINGEFTAFKSSDDTDKKSENILKIGKLTFNGDEKTISGTEKLALLLGDNIYIELSTNKITLFKNLVLSEKNSLTFDNYRAGSSGLGLYNLNYESFVETDNIIVHNFSNNQIRIGNLSDIKYEYSFEDNYGIFTNFLLSLKSILYDVKFRSSVKPVDKDKKKDPNSSEEDNSFNENSSSENSGSENNNSSENTNNENTEENNNSGNFNNSNPNKEDTNKEEKAPEIIYPEYDTELKCPKEDVLNEKYNNVVPNIEWIKKIIIAQLAQIKPTKPTITIFDSIDESIEEKTILTEELTSDNFEIILLLNKKIFIAKTKEKEPKYYSNFKNSKNYELSAGEFYYSKADKKLQMYDGDIMVSI